MRSAAFVFALGLASPVLPAQGLFGVDWDSGTLYRVDPISAALTTVGSTGLPGLGALEFGADGRLYGFTAGSNASLYRIDPATAAATFIGPLDIGFVFEGALATAPGAIAYATNQDSAGTPRLFRIDLTTGGGTLIGVISGGAHDINGLAWRSDGKLVGLDRASNSLLAIDPGTAASSVIDALAPLVGAVGGMAVLDGKGFFCTSGTAGAFPGSNELWTFDLFTGAAARVGSFAATITGTGISGLAACNGSIEKYGVGLAGSGGFVPQLAIAGCPAPGAIVTLTVAEGLGGAHGCLLVGVERNSLPYLGGTVLVVPLYVVVHALRGSGDGAGEFAAGLRVPRLPGFANSCFYFQGAYCDPGAAQGVSFTAGIKVTIGDDGST